MRDCQTQVLIFILIFSLFGACATDKKKLSPIVTKVNQIQKNLSNMAVSYGEKDEKGFFEGFDSDSDFLSLVRTRIVGDFEHFDSAEISFVFGRVEVEGGRIKTVVRWKGRWLKASDALPLEKRGKAIFFWSDVSDPKMTEMRGNTPFSAFR